MKEKIALMLQHGELDAAFLESLTVHELMSEVRIIQQELVDRNHDLMSKCSDLQTQVENYEKAERELVTLSAYDQLTGVYNRHYFEQRILEEIERADRYNEPLSLLIMSLDHFKRINETWEYAVGDAVLKQAAKIVASILRTSDILARTRNEEFIIIMPQTNLEGVLVAAEKIRHALETNLHPIVGHYTASFGVSERANSESFVSWHKRLLQALSRAKEKGRNRVEIAEDPGINQTQLTELKWTSEWESGNPDIDDQHRELLKMANSLIQLVGSDVPAEKIAIQLELLNEKLTTHFDAEDYILQVVAYPDFIKQTRSHKRILEQALKYKELYKIGKFSLHSYCSFIVDEFVIGHLLIDDILFFPYIKNLPIDLSCQCGKI